MTRWNRNIQRLRSGLENWPISDSEPCRKRVLDHLRRVQEAQEDSTGLKRSEMFWPPRVVSAIKGGGALIFFGSGVSFAAKLPSWNGLLRQIGVDQELESDPYASGDMLTLAELAAHLGGVDTLQDSVRRAVGSAGKMPTLAHHLLAALDQNVYVTTNYDNLFERAWEEVHGPAQTDHRGVRLPMVVTHDDDVRKNLGNTVDEALETLRAKKSYCVLKIHGCVTRDHEHLVLTRSDYRRHYRTNPLMFDLLRRRMLHGHTLFLGFGHRDPEVTRLIDDVVHEFEVQKSNDRGSTNVYSLQFDMQKRTPEVFAARGIVALQPSLVLPQSADEDVKGIALARGLGDLLYACERDAHARLSLDSALEKISNEIDRQFASAFKFMEEEIAKDALQALATHDQARARALLARVLKTPECSGLANQGAYLVAESGELFELELPDGLDRNYRLSKSSKDFGARPYFRKASSYRVPFVSDSFCSIFNDHATVATCVPLLVDRRFSGLIFIAHQFGAEGFVQQVKDIAAKEKCSLLLVDANGVLVVPPGRELEAQGHAAAGSPEPAANNVGYNFDALLAISRQDKRVERIAHNVVPLAQDDDIFGMAPDVTVYSVVKELSSGRWKVALGRFLRRTIDADDAAD